MKLLFAAPIAALISASPAAARDYYYFNKPGVDRQAYLEDRLACDALAGGVARISPDTTAMNQQIWQNNNLTAGQSAAAGAQPPTSGGVPPEVRDVVIDAVRQVLQEMGVPGQPAQAEAQPAPVAPAAATAVAAEESLVPDPDKQH